MSFLVLAAYVAFDSLESLWQREHPEHSTAGIILAIVSLIGTPSLVAASFLLPRLLN